MKTLLSICRYYGLKGTAAKVWEKYVVDRKRFHTDGKTEVPTFPPCPERELPVIEGSTVLYLLFGPLFLSEPAGRDGALCIQYGAGPTGKRAPGKSFYSGYGRL